MLCLLPQWKYGVQMQLQLFVIKPTALPVFRFVFNQIFIWFPALSAKMFSFNLLLLWTFYKVVNEQWQRGLPGPLDILKWIFIDFGIFIDKKRHSARNVVCVRLLLAPKELILLLHLLHAQAGRPVLLGLTFLICGPVLNPGPLTENVLKPADAGDKSVATRLNQYVYNSGMWLQGNWIRRFAQGRSQMKQTYVCARSTL